MSAATSTRHDLPYHPLWNEGYVSIGDVHTTRRWEPGMREEDTRFFGHQARVRPAFRRRGSRTRGVGGPSARSAAAASYKI